MPENDRWPAHRCWLAKGSRKTLNLQMIKIFVEVILENSMENNDPKHELFVPAIPNRGDCIRIKEKGSDLTNAYIVTSIVFFEEKNKKCSVCVLVKHPDAA
jgi:hypothetical protein